MNRQIATFFLGDTLLGVDILLVKEIFRQKDMTRIPDAPAHLRGLMNLRGKIVTVIDLNVCLNIGQNRQASADMENGRLLILKTRDEIGKQAKRTDVTGVDPGEDIVGFPIDNMDDVMTVKATDILPVPPNLRDVDSRLIRGVIKKGEGLVLLLNVGEILDLVLDKAFSIEVV